MLIYVHIIHGIRNSPKQILTVYAQPTESILTLMKRIIKTLNARGNRFSITVNDWFISAGRGLCDEKKVQDYIKFDCSIIYVLKRYYRD